MPKVTSAAVYYDRRRMNYKDRDSFETRALFPATVKKERWSKVAGKPANKRGTTRL